MLKDRTTKKVITHRIAVGKPGNKQNGKPVQGSHPTSLDHFLITGVEEQPNGQFLEDVEAMERVSAIDPKRYGPPTKLRRIPIRVDSDRIDDFLVQKYASRRMLPVIGGDGLPVMVQGERDEAPKPLQRLRVWCEGNGEVASRLNREGTEHTACLCNASPRHKARTRAELEGVLKGTIKYDPATDTLRCPFAQLSQEAAARDAPDVFKKAPTCKPETVLISRCDAIASIGVFSRTRSHGHQTADRLRSTIDEIKKAMPAGMLGDIPLDLCLQMVATAVPGMNARRPQPVLHVELRLSPDETIAIVENSLRRRLSVSEAAQANRKLLAAARTEVEAEEVEGEFVIVHGRDGSGGVRV